MSFVATDQGLVNLKFVKRIRTDVKDDRDDLVTLYDSAGFAMGKTNRESLDDHLLGDLVPAGPGVFATVISSSAELRRPAMQDIEVDRVPIVAWRIQGTLSAVPIFVEPPIGVVFIETGTNRLILPHEAIFDDLTNAKEFCLTEEQSIWDQRHVQPTVPSDDHLADQEHFEESIARKYE